MLDLSCDDFHLIASSVDKLKSEAHVTVPVEVKFVNRARREVQLEWITPQGRREKKKVLPKGRCWRTTSWEGHYWVCCDPKHDQHLFALNYGLHYRAHKTRGLRERVVITAGKTQYIAGDHSMCYSKGRNPDNRFPIPFPTTWGTNVILILPTMLEQRWLKICDCHDCNNKSIGWITSIVVSSVVLLCWKLTHSLTK